MFGSIATEGRDIGIGIYKQKRGESKLAATTRAWNWQQGCRRRWLRNHNQCIMINNFCEGRYMCRFVEINSGAESRVEYPIYDIDSSSRYGATLDFGRLGVKRAGYGYVNLQYNNIITEDSEAIAIVDLQSQQKVHVITYKALIDRLKTKPKSLTNVYINQIGRAHV